MFGPYGQVSIIGAICLMFQGKTLVETWDNGLEMRKIVRNSIKGFGYHHRVTRAGDLIGEFNDHEMTEFTEVRRVLAYADDTWVRTH